MSEGMIIHHCDVFGLHWAVRRARNPHLVSFDDRQKLDDGEVDLAKRLGAVDSGSGHDCYLKGVTVNFDVYCDQSIHRQLLRYRFIDVVSSMSIEHSYKSIILNDFLMQDVDPEYRTELKNKMASLPKRDVIRAMPMATLLGISFSTNYLQLKTIYRQRRTHTHPGWAVFTEYIIDELPSFALLTGVET